ncbi:hypothetical protein D1871_11220 [Nakamurella silvestris]|nr:hypothetical protein D1871_11220 [Nakamurella silvestris]
MRVTANATRSGGWWAVSVPEVEGLFTQAKRLDQIPAMVADAVELLTNVPAASVEVTVRPEVPESVRAHLAEAEVQREASAAANSRAAAETREAARELKEQGMPLRDVGAVLGVSYQRAFQLVSESV